MRAIRPAAEIGRTLWQRARGLGSVTTVNHALVTALLVENGVARGVTYYDSQGRPQRSRAARTLLATGGAGQVFRETTNPAVATGDGIALAFDAGARVCDLEFVQFHPTALNHPDAPRFLISEAVRGEGARLVNSHGEPFMPRYHSDGDLAPRDVVARSIVRESARTGGGVFLTLAHLTANVRDRFPTIAAACRQVGLDLAKDPIPVGPAAHYVMGGIDTDEWGAHVAARVVRGGRNRLHRGPRRQPPREQFAARGPRVWRACRRRHAAGRASGRPERATESRGPRLRLRRHDVRPATADPPERKARRRVESPSPDEIRDIMWRAAGLFRTRDELASAVARLDAAYAGGAADGDARLPTIAASST